MIVLTSAVSSRPPVSSIAVSISERTKPFAVAEMLQVAELDFIQAIVHCYFAGAPCTRAGSLRSWGPPPTPLRSLIRALRLIPRQELAEPFAAIRVERFVMPERVVGIHRDEIDHAAPVEAGFSRPYFFKYLFAHCCENAVLMLWLVAAMTFL